MNREFTVLLKQPENSLPPPPPPSKLKKVWDWLNNLVKSPIVIFLFGSTISAFIYKGANSLFESTEQLKLIKQQEQARSDGMLIAPFLTNLNTTDSVKFEASIAALNALEIELTGTNICPEKNEQNKQEVCQNKRAVFRAVNHAISKVATKILPQTPTLNEKETQALDKTLEHEKTKESESIKPAVALSVDAEQLEKSYYEKLQSSLSIIYIQVDISDKIKQDEASKIRNYLIKNKIITPNIEKIDSKKIPQKTQVRYFNGEDKEKAESLASIIKITSDINAYSIKPNIKGVKIGTLELWLGKEKS